MPALSATDTLIRHGTPEFRRTTLALFSAGFATFALLYCVQPLLPVFARVFSVSPAASSLPLSLTTGVLAPAMIVGGAISESYGRKPLMLASLLASAVLTVAAAFAPGWSAFLVLRALCGITFAGLPAISMTYLSEEVAPTSIGLAMGLTIAGNGLGGMIGRLLAALVTDLLSWRYAMGITGLLGFVATAVCFYTLPPSRHFTPRATNVRALTARFGQQLRDVHLLALYAEGFLLMGGLITTYNYVAYHLLAPPYRLSQAAVGFIFGVYPVGIFASAWIGSLADRVGRRRMLILMLALMLVGLALTFARPVAIVITGISAVTFGFFGGHSVASSWVGLRAHAAPAQASALYLFSYYVGSSIAGSVGGIFWSAAGWAGVVAFVGAMLGTGILVAAVATRPSFAA